MYWDDEKEEYSILNTVNININVLFSNMKTITNLNL